MATPAKQCPLVKRETIASQRTNERTPRTTQVPRRTGQRGNLPQSLRRIGHEYRRARPKQTTRKRRKRKLDDGSASPGRTGDAWDHWASLA
ncbi:putative disease resistance protein [Anopheles sinensis]|uniref:Putative disease resistance protein n=1 Tax=Anopheles sinensis TaxID=74873 RepID=A0A084WF53_ANOSI|nr:putative disease resistance protein [Anopheles sinensis]